MPGLVGMSKKLVVFDSARRCGIASWDAGDDDSGPSGFARWTPMAQRPLLKADRWAKLLDAPSDEETLIRHYTLGQADLDLIRAKATAHNQLGLAIQLCLMRNLGRSWRHDEVPPAALVTFIAHQIDVPSIALRDYGRRGQNRREHALEVQRHLGLRQPDKHDLRAALGAALEAADATDHGQPIAEAILATLRERRTLLPAADTLDRLGRGARAIARRRMEAALVAGFTTAELATKDDLLVLNPAVQMSRFAWLRALPEAPSERNLLALMDRLRFVRDRRLDPGEQVPLAR